MFQTYFWVVLCSLVSRLLAACTSKITITNKIDDAVNVAYFITHSDNIELDAKIFCAKFSLSTETCNTVIPYHTENCLSDEDLYKTMAFYAPDDCYSSKYLKVCVYSFPHYSYLPHNDLIPFFTHSFPHLRPYLPQ